MYCTVRNPGIRAVSWPSRRNRSSWFFRPRSVKARDDVMRISPPILYGAPGGIPFRQDDACRKCSTVQYSTRAESSAFLEASRFRVEYLPYEGYDTKEMPWRTPGEQETECMMHYEQWLIRGCLLRRREDRITSMLSFGILR